MATAIATYWTLHDGSNPWYVYLSGDAEVVISSEEPSSSSPSSIWTDYEYGLTPDAVITEAASGIKYITFVDSDDETWYVYPNSDGELVVTTEVPS